MHYLSHQTALFQFHLWNTVFKLYAGMHLCKDNLNKFKVFPNCSILRCISMISATLVLFGVFCSQRAVMALAFF